MADQPNVHYGMGMGFNISNFESSFQIRLSTSEILRMIEAFLQGKRITIETYTDSNGETKQKEKFIDVGKPLVNPLGIQGIMFKCQMIFNPQSVQGNIKNDNDYRKYIASLRRDFAEELMENMYNWEIKLENYPLIINTIIAHAKLFVSRTLDNEERKSYMQTVRQYDTTTIQDKTKEGGFKLPFIGGN